ncbi:MAG: sulfatase-like hydrolase/transferase, partial [Candidatus Paceibacteria bacterium]
MEHQPNVLLVVLDSVRASNTSIHGHENDTTPFLLSLSQSETLYTQARAPGTESISSHTSMFTGYTVREHGITDRRAQLTQGHTIWEELANQGYATGVFSSNPFLTELPVGLSNGFDTVVGRSIEQPYPEAVNPKRFVVDSPDAGLRKYSSFLRAVADNGNIVGSIANGLSFKFNSRQLPKRLQPDGSAEQYVDHFIRWFKNKDQPWAACLNLMDAHYSYEPDPAHDHWGGEKIKSIQAAVTDQAWEFVAGDRPWGQRQALESLYDGAIHQADAALRRVVNTLEKSEMLDNTLIIVTADHGEGFGERSLVRPDARIVGHGNGGIHECVLHVPLVVSYPWSVGGGEYDKLASLA